MNTQHTFKPSKLARALSLGVAMLALQGTAQAYSYDKGDFSLTWDNSISYGFSMRVENRADDLVGKANHNPLVFTLPYPEQVAATGRWSVNSDDGNLLFDQGDLISNAIKWTTELGFSYGNFGGFFRASAFYDDVYANRSDLSDPVKKLVGSDLRLLDGYLYWDFDLGNLPGSIRVGNQVVNWGESAFIQGGINIINAVDVSKLRVAGAELKEALMPQNMVWGSLDLTDNLSMEAVYLMEFEQIDPDPARTYFSSNDFATPGGEFVMLGFGLFDEQFPGLTINRLPDRYPDSSGQWGLAFRYFAESLNDTEFGLFYNRYHSRLPLISGVAVSNASPASGGYFVEYPDNIDMYGFSFNSNFDNGVAVAGEVSYRPNLPLQMDDVELLFSALSPLNAVIPEPVNRFISQMGEYGFGEEIRGWERHKVTQAQITITNVFGPNNPFKADQLAVVAEAGLTQVWDLPPQDVLRYNGPGTDTSGGPDVTSGRFRNPQTETRGFATEFSWGLRTFMRMTYNNAFGTAFNLSPRIGYNIDMQGVSPGPGGQFVEGRKTLSLGLNGTYLEKWSADISYTRYMGAGRYNLLRDRDFASFNIKYSF